MTKKKKKIDKIIIPKEKIYEAKKPRYNAFQGGYGAQGEIKYNRKEKHRKDLKYDY